MKKGIFLSLVITAIAASSLFSQQNRFNVGIIGGVSRNFLYGNSYLKSSNVLTAFSAGVIVQYNFPGILSVVSGLSYDLKGQQINVNYTDSRGNPIGTVKVKSLFNYQTIPLMLKATFGKRFGFFVEGGGYFSYLDKATSDAPGLAMNNPKSDMTAYFERIDAGLAFGLGINVPLSKHIMLSLEGRNNLGLYHINKMPVYNHGSVKTNATNVLLSIVYKLGKRR